MRVVRQALREPSPRGSRIRHLPYPGTGGSGREPGSHRGPLRDIRVPVPCRVCAGARFSPDPYPSEVGDRRCWAARVGMGEVSERHRSDPRPPRSEPRGRGRSDGNGGYGPGALRLPCRLAGSAFPRPPLRFPEHPPVAVTHLPLDLRGALALRLAQRGPFVPVIPVEILAPALDRIPPAPHRPDQVPQRSLDPPDPKPPEHGAALPGEPLPLVQKDDSAGWTPGASTRR